MSTLQLFPPAAVSTNDNPFPGLRPFQPGEEHLFFGRERQIDSMVDRLATTRFLAVVGTSGSGKSSLVNCGLRPALHRGLMSRAGSSWRVVSFRPGANPIRALAQALAAEGSLYSGYAGEIPLAEIMETHLRMSNRGLVEVVKRARLPERTNLLLVVDQFEELFRYRKLQEPSGGGGEDEDATALVNLLLETSAHAEPIYVVLTMRSDFLGDCSRFHGLPEAINQGQYLVPRLTRDERRAAIAGPIRHAGAEIHPALLTRLVNDVGDDPDQLSILQHALNRTWAHWKRGGSEDSAIGLDDYMAIGTMAEALDRHAEKAFSELGSERQKWICEKMFRALTDRGTDARGIRRPTTFTKLCELTEASPAEITTVIDVFRKPSRSFLMPPLAEALEPETVVDLSHETLMRVWRRLKEWTEEEAQSARMYRRLADTAMLHAEGRASLWRDPELQLALEWRRQQDPPAAWADLYGGRFGPSMAFLDRSRAARDAALAESEFQRAWRRIRVVLFGVAAIVALLSLFLVFPFVQGWLAPPQGTGIEATIRTIPEIAPALMVMLLALVAPFVAIYLAGEYLGKPVYRRYRFGAIEHKVASRQDQRASSSMQEPAADSVPPEVRWQTSYAPVWRRAIAFLVDGLIALTLLFLGMMVAAILENTPAEVPMSNTWVLVGAVFGVLLGWLYQSRGLTSARQATLGMRVAGVFVTDTRGDPLSVARATLRHACKAVGYIYGVGLLTYPFTKRRQMLHDWLSGSVVLTGARRTGDRSAPGPAGVIPVHSIRLPEARSPAP